MKQIQVKIVAPRADIVEGLIEKYKLDATIIEDIEGNRIFTFNIQDSQSNNFLYELKALGVGDVFGEITVTPIQLILTSKKAQSTIGSSSAANIEEILADLEDNSSISSTYIALVLLSGALAAFGLLANSVVIIIGSMIVAPLLGPVALTSIGFLVPDRGLLRKGLTAEGLGILLTVVIAFIIGFFGDPDNPTFEMMTRAADADRINIVFALISGIAAGVIITRGQGLSIVGVAIAASLAPPAANIGLFLSYYVQSGAIETSHFVNAEIAAAILFMNIFAINASCSIIFSVFRLPSRSGISKRRTTRAQRTNNIITAFILLAFTIISIILFTQLSPTGIT